jgi:hypothetical protein
MSRKKFSKKVKKLNYKKLNKLRRSSVRPILGKQNVERISLYNVHNQYRHIILLLKYLSQINNETSYTRLTEKNISNVNELIITGDYKIDAILESIENFRLQRKYKFSYCKPDFSTFTMSLLSLLRGKFFRSVIFGNSYRQHLELYAEICQVISKALQNTILFGNANGLYRSSLIIYLIDKINEPNANLVWYLYIFKKYLAKPELWFYKASQANFTKELFDLFKKITKTRIFTIAFREQIEQILTVPPGIYYNLQNLEKDIEALNNQFNDKIYFAALANNDGETLGNKLVLLNIDKFQNSEVPQNMKSAGMIVTLLHELIHLFLRVNLITDSTIFDNSPRKNQRRTIDEKDIEDNGDKLETRIFCHKVPQVSYDDAEFLLNITNWEVNNRDHFRQSYMQEYEKYFNLYPELDGGRLILRAVKRNSPH